MLLAIAPFYLFFKIPALIFGVFLAAGCIKGLVTRQDVYDAASAKWMNTVQVVGVLFSLILIAYGFDFIDLPDWAYDALTSWPVGF